jgi:hypothetical protein
MGPVRQSPKSTGWVSIDQGENQSTCSRAGHCAGGTPSALTSEGNAISMCGLTAAAEIAGPAAAATTLGSLSPESEPEA